MDSSARNETDGGHQRDQVQQDHRPERALYCKFLVTMLALAVMAAAVLLGHSDTSLNTMTVHADQLHSQECGLGAGDILLNLAGHIDEIVQFQDSWEKWYSELKIDLDMLKASICTSPPVSQLVMATLQSDGNQTEMPDSLQHLVNLTEHMERSLTLTAKELAVDDNGQSLNIQDLLLTLEQLDCLVREQHKVGSTGMLPSEFRPCSTAKKSLLSLLDLYESIVSTYTKFHATAEEFANTNECARILVKFATDDEWLMLKPEFVTDDEWLLADPEFRMVLAKIVDERLIELVEGLGRDMEREFGKPRVLE